ncbi:MAG: prepilin-type N-terminal cleavage/methylation domain-containing protein [Candidatus Aminicenantes bacterium]|nr:prepilin-type N-terminal cleavage/methylation domain-containing protein [Candidatus Aminicenantes bacterium]
MRGQKIKNKNAGFTLIEVLLCIALIALALLGLAQIFTLSVLNNMRSDRLTTANFLAQQQVDFLRSLTLEEIGINYLGQTKDERLDINNDGTFDYRRITKIETAQIIPSPTTWPSTGTLSGNYFKVRVLVFSAEQLNRSVEDLIKHPERYRVKAQLLTIISR